jgi:hypothetical protein
VLLSRFGERPEPAPGIEQTLGPASGAAQFVRFREERIMFKHRSARVVAAILFLACLGAVPAQAASLVTFVSGSGADKGACDSASKPCRTFQFAIKQTSAGGEIKALDPANYGPLTVTQSISITGVDGAGINVTGAFGIVINTGVNDTINLTNLILDGGRAALSGILLNTGGSLTITHCVVRNFANGIDLVPNVRLDFLIADTVVSNNSDDGITVNELQSTTTASGTLDHVLMKNNSHIGLVVGNLVRVTATASAAINNISGVGFGVEANGFLLLAGSNAVQNHVGVSSAGTVISFGDNHIFNNDQDVVGALTNVGTQ